MENNRVTVLNALLALVICLSVGLPGAHATGLNENCVVSILNRTVQVKADGTWVLPNIPANFGPVRARATCVQDSVTQSGQSELFTVPANDSTDVPEIALGVTTAIPAQITVKASVTRLTQAAQTAQLTVLGHYTDGSSQDLTNASKGTQYRVSNAEIATISTDGLVTARHSGTVLVQATNEGAQGLMQLSIVLSDDSDGDGIPDDVEVRLGLDPDNPADALDDADRDGLTNLDELQRGTDPVKADTDGDGLMDGEEVKIGSNPLLNDTDGDGVPDNIEVATGSDPLDEANYNLGAALKGISVSPASFSINVNTVDLVAFQQLQVTGEFNLGGTIDLTSQALGTHYVSSNLQVCNFGVENGRVFGGSDGICTITVTNNGFSATAKGTVKTFTPQALSFVAIPGYANNVDVSGNYAYVASGSTGMQVVDVSNKTAPKVVASFDSPGNGNDIAIVGNYAYLADGPMGLQVIDISNPLAPVLAGAFDTPATAWDVVVREGHAFVAAGTGGLQIVDVSNPAAPSLAGSLTFGGTAKGVDVDLTRKIAVIAMGTGGIHVVNINDLSHPALLGSVTGGDVLDVALKGNYAFLADFSRSFTVVNLTDPVTPVVGASTSLNLGGRLQDVVLAGNLALGADMAFINHLPIIDISLPVSPQPRAILNFSGYRDDNGTGISADASYVYLTTEKNISENGVIGDSRLYIGQFRELEDNGKVLPTVSVSSPLAGDTVIQGQKLTISAQADDDIAVASVTFSVNGADVFTDTTAPFETTYQVPSDATALTIAATAFDLGGNMASSLSISVTAIPDPLTTVIGRVVDTNGSPIANTNVSLFNIAGTTLADGAFSISGVSTGMGNIVVKASAMLNGKLLQGFSVPAIPVPGATTSVGDIKLSEKRIALIHSKYALTTNVKWMLASTGLILAENITLIDATASTPSLDALSNFDAVLVWTNYNFQNPILLGDILADYVDQGGGLVLATYVFLESWGIAGRITDVGMSPFAVSNGRIRTSGVLDFNNSNISHPILSGVSSANYWVNSNYTNPALTQGAILIARDTSGNNVIAVNPSNNVVGISIYPGYGDGGLIFANALNFVSRKK